MRIRLASVPVTSADQDKALAFYTGKLGFVKHRDIPMGRRGSSPSSRPRSPTAPS
jgi:catechol 2,3-dioxygenase-like lactoylglutathione lyase family enzyme